MGHDISERVAELASKRDRTDLPPLEKSARVQILNEIYDGLLYLWKQCVMTGTAKGTSAIQLQLAGARLELESVGGQVSEFADIANGVTFKLPLYKESLNNNDETLNNN